MREQSVSWLFLRLFRHVHDVVSAFYDTSAQRARISVQQANLTAIKDRMV